MSPHRVSDPTSERRTRRPCVLRHTLQRACAPAREGEAPAERQTAGTPARASQRTVSESALAWLALGVLGSLAGCGPLSAPHPAASPAEPDRAPADTRQWLLGQQAAAGELYAYARGPQLRVGARERFELTFSGGALVAWHAGESPNLTAAPGLGPWPVDLSADWTADPHAAASAIPHQSLPPDAGTQRVIEANDLRVIVAAGRDTAPRDDVATAAAPPADLSRYTIYADGRIFVRTTWQMAGDNQRQQRRGYALILNGRGDFEALLPPGAGSQHEPAEFILLRRGPAPAAHFLWTTHSPPAITRRRLVHDDRQQRLIALAGDVAAADTFETAHLLRIWPPDLNSASAAESLAHDYQNPVRLHPLTGHLVDDAPGDLNGDGYNESHGCYELATREGRLRFEFDPAGQPRCHPVFRVHGTIAKRCWVYANGAAISLTQRDAAGRLLFALPGMIRTPRIIEVYSRTENAAAPK